MASASPASDAHGCAEHPTDSFCAMLQANVVIAAAAAERQQSMSVEVFSVEDAYSKTIGNITAGTTLAALIDILKGELGYEDLQVTFGSRVFATDDFCCTLGSLGVSEGSLIACSMCAVNRSAFAINVCDMSGRECKITGLVSDMTLADLVSLVEKELEVRGDVEVRLLDGTRVFEISKHRTTLSTLGIGDGCELTAVKQARDKRMCPSCTYVHRVLFDVTVGSTHEGWGRRWNECNYSCQHCSNQIQSGESVVVCLACRCFWHKSCPQTSA